MEYFNKEEYKQLKNLPRSESQKKITLNRIRNNNKQIKNYPLKYIITSAVALLLVFSLIGLELFNSKQQANEPFGETVNSSSTIATQDLMSKIFNSIDIGMTKDEIKQILGNLTYAGSITGIEKDDVPIWRYELKKNGDYIVGGTTLELEEMDKGKIDALLFIFWDEQYNKVEQFSAIYKDGTDGHIYDIRKLQDNTVLKQSIYPTENVNTDNITIDLEVVKTQLKFGMTMDEVIKILGTHFKTGVDAFNGTIIWNYNYGESPDKNKDGLIEVEEFEEILKGKFQAQFSIQWDENNLFSSIYGIYVNEKENRLYEYGLFTDGQTKDSPID